MCRCLVLHALQRHCNGTATALQRHCNVTATSLQRHCNGTATALQRHCISTASALQRQHTKRRQQRMGGLQKVARDS
jgi:hypothetical protein